MKKLLWLLAGAGLLVSALPTGAGEAEDIRDRVRFQVRVSEEVANDWMRVELAAEAQGRAPAEVAAAINEAMQWALAEARQVPVVEARTGNYFTGQVRDKDRPGRWHGSQRLILESGDQVALAALMGRLQQRLTVKAVGFSVAGKSRAQAVERLTTRAISTFRARAAKIAADFGARGYHLVSAAIATGRSAEPAPLRVQALAAVEVPPALEAGQGQVEVSVSGTIELVR